jgi:D-alanyl-D-alanine carboxypeptidase
VASAPPPFHFDAALAQQDLDALVQHYDAAGGIVAVSVSGGTPTVLTSGVAPGTATALQPNARVLVASLSKLFVGALTLRLVDEGRVDLDASLARYGIDWTEADKITVRMLLEHTSGIPPLGGDRGRPDPYQSAFASFVGGAPNHHFTIDEILAFAHARPNDFAPGTSTSYTNLDTILAAKVDELVTGEPIGRLLHDRILDPLHLDGTAYEPDEGLGDGAAAPDSSIDDDAFLSALGPAGAMVSDAPDLLTFANAFLHDRTLVSSSSEALATTISAGGTGAGTLGFGGFNRHDSFCVFLDTGCRPGTVFSGVGGSGSIPGVSTILVDDKASDTVVFVYVFREGVPCEFLTHAIFFSEQFRF